MMKSACLFAAVVLAASASAQAAVVLTLESGAFSSTVSGASLANNTSIAINGYTLSTNVGVSNSPGTPAEGVLQITTISIRNSGSADPLKITLSAVDYDAPGSPGDEISLLSSVGGTITGNAPGLPITFQSFADPNNAQPATAVAAPLQTYISTGALLESFSNDVTTSFARSLSSDYSLANVLVLTLAPGAQANISGTTVTFVPEPAALGLLAAALPMVARRRRA
jgi:hypothetical protein